MKKSHQTKRRTIKNIVVGCVLLLLASTGWALDLQEEKSNGSVKENGKGYLEVVDKNNQDVASFVEEINAKRKTKFAEIAKRNNISLEAVEKQAAKKLMK